MSAAESFAAPPPDIATKLELDQRVEARAEPVIEPQLNIDGWQQVEVSRQLDIANENRIAALRGSLDTAHETLNTDMRLANLRGSAAADFERSR